MTYKDVPCVENRRWTYGGVTYATFDVQGSCNNLCDTNPDPIEEGARNAADIQWLDQTFAEAKANGSAGVMLISQADPGFDGSDATRAPLRNPVTLADASTGTGKRIENFTRLETFGDNQQSGDNDVQWVKVLVDPSSRDVFAFQPQVVPANVPVYSSG